MTGQHLLDDIAVALILALAGGLAARALGLSSIFGFLVAGIAIGPFTPGYVADAAGLQLLAEMGVIFLLFGVGLHFDLGDLARVRAVALPGALLQMTVTTVLGTVAGSALGLEVRTALLLGLATSVASTVVLTRTLEERRLLDAPHGHLAVGWLVAQDLATVLVLALIPTLGDQQPDFTLVATAIAKAAVFLAIMLVAGARLLPALLRFVAATGSRELFILAIIATALSIAAGAAAFGLSVALGAFIAGLAVSEEETGRVAAESVLPLREAFAVLFFVSVGMLVDPGVLVANLDLLLAALALIAANATTTLVIVRLVPRWRASAPFMSASLAQIGEFSFVIAAVGLTTGLLSAEAYNAILGASVVSIALNPLVFRALAPAPQPGTPVAATPA